MRLFLDPVDVMTCTCRLSGQVQLLCSHESIYNIMFGRTNLHEIKAMIDVLFEHAQFCKPSGARRLLGMGQKTKHPLACNCDWTTLELETRVSHRLVCVGWSFTSHKLCICM